MKQLKTIFVIAVLLFILMLTAILVVAQEPPSIDPSKSNCIQQPGKGLTMIIENAYKSTAYNRNLKTPAINLPDSFISKRSVVPLLRNENAGLWKKIKRAELFIGGAELLGAIVLIVAPNKVTKWSPDWEQDAWRHMKRSLSKLPVWDDDEWPINFIGHPVAGSFHYNSLRSQHASIFHSFLFATAQSFIWEYIVEATAEKPSTQDLFITPIVGSILGESIHRLTMSMRRNGFNFFEKIFVLIFNPPFVFNNGFGPRVNPVRK